MHHASSTSPVAPVVPGCSDAVGEGIPPISPLRFSVSSAVSGVLGIFLAAALIGASGIGAHSTPDPGGAAGAPIRFGTEPAVDLAELSKEPPAAEPTMTGDAAVESASSEVRENPLRPAARTLASPGGRASDPEIRDGHDTGADVRAALRLGVGFCAYISGCQAAFEHAAGPLYQLFRVYQI